MASDGSNSSKNSLEISFGKEIGAAFGDVVRGMLKRPSEALGDLVADGIGIVGDHVKRKRELNAQLGMQEVRKRLDADGVDIKDITPPKEEELHLLLNGMSLAGDESVRAMWAGLFAKSLEPDSEVTAERPFINLLQSLSPMDAKIIDLLAFIHRTEVALKAKEGDFVAEGFTRIVDGEQDRETQNQYFELQRQAIALIQQKADDYGLSGNISVGWADNLFRQGVIEMPPVRQFTNLSNFRLRSGREGDLAKAIENIHESLQVMQEVTKRQSTPPESFFGKHAGGARLPIQVQFTDFGRRFASACGLQ